MWSGIARSVGFVVLFVIGIWAVGELVGFEIGLWSTLIASVVLTVLGNLIFGGIQRMGSSPS